MSDKFALTSIGIVQNSELISMDVGWP